jgi:hypothetical protein
LTPAFPAYAAIAVPIGAWVESAERLAARKKMDNDRDHGRRAGDAAQYQPLFSGYYADPENLKVNATRPRRGYEVQTVQSRSWLRSGQ